MIYVDGYAPMPNSINNSNATNIGFNLLDTNSGLYGNSIEVFIDGKLIFENETFVSQFSSSTFTPTTVGADDGYEFLIINNSTYPNGALTIDIIAENLTTTANIRWAILIGDTHNSIYFADGYGIQKLKMTEAIGNCFSLTRNLFPTLTDVSYLHSETVDGYYYLSVSTPASALVIKNEADPNLYMDGYDVGKVQMNDRGILYAINKDKNWVEVYYGAHFRSGDRLPDFIYSSTSTPAIMAGTINDIHIANGVSAITSGGGGWSRLYVGTSLGMTRIETYDRERPDGYADGYDVSGLAINYGIVGSGATYEIIGGTVANVYKINSTDAEGVIFVIMNDGAGNGSVSQLSLYTNRRIIHMTKENGFLPSNDVRDIVG